MKVTFNNDKSRRFWLEQYHAWGVWFRVPETGATWYRCYLPDGTMLIVEEYPEVTHKHPVTYKTKTTNYFRIANGECFGGTLSMPGDIFGVLHKLRGEVNVRYPDNSLDMEGSNESTD